MMYRIETGIPSSCKEAHTFGYELQVELEGRYEATCVSSGSALHNHYTMKFQFDNFDVVQEAIEFIIEFYKRIGIPLQERIGTYILGPFGIEEE